MLKHEWRKVKDGCGNVVFQGIDQLNSTFFTLIRRMLYIIHRIAYFSVRPSVPIL
jgi:hypothetical protein